MTEVEVEILDNGDIMVSRGTPEENKLLWDVLQTSIVDPGSLSQFLANPSELLVGDSEMCG